jgi:hypothetical protein
MGRLVALLYYMLHHRGPNTRSLSCTPSMTIRHLMASTKYVESCFVLIYPNINVDPHTETRDVGLRTFSV